MKLHPKVNLIHGANGAGKTSILEAIYYLGMGKSFRSSLPARLIQQDSGKFIVVGKQKNHEKTNTIGIERLLDGTSTIRVNGETQKNRENLILTTPLQLVDVAGHRVIEEGPGARREFLDWGLFHVKPEFISCWRRVKKTLRQRNSLLKTKQPRLSSQLTPWDKDLAQFGSELHALREEYMRELTPITEEILEKLLETDISISYHPGWNTEKDLFNLLQSRHSTDISLGYTGIGPQKADIRFKMGNIPAQEKLSRGQQKLLVCALQLAQGHLVKKLTGKDCLYLVDDLPSELDGNGRRKVLRELANSSSQVFITSIASFPSNEKKAIGNDYSLFHVKQGVI